MGKDLKGKELGSGITQRKDGKYCGRFTSKLGKRISIYDPDLKSLRRRLNEAIYEDENALAVVDKNVTLDVWFNRWLDAYKRDTVRDSTIFRYSQLYEKHISPAIGGCAVAELTQMHMKNVLNDLVRKGYSWETQNAARILLNNMMRNAVSMNLIKKNPMFCIGKIMDKPDKDRIVLTIEQQRAFFECAAGTFYNNLFVVAINSGLRPGELYALTEGDIDFDARLIRVSKTLLYQKLEGDTGKTFHLHPTKTKTSERVVPITDACAEALQKQIRQKEVVSKRFRVEEFKDLLFTTNRNNPINSQIYTDAITRIVREVNLTRDLEEQLPIFTGHSFRHTFATRCIEAGIRPKTLQAYLGHATLQMTMDLYVHVTTDVKHQEIQLLEDYFSENKK